MSLIERLRELLHVESRRHGWGLLLVARDVLRRVILEVKPRRLLDIGCHNRLLERTVVGWLGEVGVRCYTVGIDVVIYDVPPEVIASGDSLPFRDGFFRCCDVD